MFKRKISIGELAHLKRVQFRKTGKNEIDFAQELKSKFEAGKIDAADILEAAYIVQFESNLLYSDKKKDDNLANAYRQLDLLACCMIEIFEKGKVELSKGNLSYIRSTLPFKFFVERYIKRLSES